MTVHVQQARRPPQIGRPRYPLPAAHFSFAGTEAQKGLPLSAAFLSSGQTATCPGRPEAAGELPASPWGMPTTAAENGANTWGGCLVVPVSHRSSGGPSMALLAFVLIGVVALGVTAYLRSARRDARSVEGYRATMEHLQQVAGNRSAEPVDDPVVAHVRVLPGAHNAAGSQSPPNVSRTPARSGAAPAARGAPPTPTPPRADGPTLTFVDDATADLSPPPRVSANDVSSLATQSSKRATPRMRLRKAARDPRCPLGRAGSGGDDHRSDRRCRYAVGPPSEPALEPIRTPRLA